MQCSLNSTHSSKNIKKESEFCQKPILFSHDSDQTLIIQTGFWLSFKIIFENSDTFRWYSEKIQTEFSRDSDVTLTKFRRHLAKTLTTFRLFFSSRESLSIAIHQGGKGTLLGVGYITRKFLFEEFQKFFLDESVYTFRTCSKSFDDVRNVWWCLTLFLGLYYIFYVIGKYIYHRPMLSGSYRRWLW